MPHPQNPSLVSSAIRMFFHPFRRPPGAATEEASALPAAVAVQPAANADETLLRVVASLLKTGRQSSALSMIERACRDRPLQPQLHNCRGLVLKACRREADALAAFDRALDLWPDYQEAFYNRQRLLGLVCVRV